MSVKGQIDRLSQAKTDIVAALKAKGLAVSADIGLDKTPDLILKLGNATSSPLTGTVDNNIITLAGDLTDGTYALRYYDNGKYIDIGTLTVSGGASTAPDTTLTWAVGTKIDTSTGAETTGTDMYSASNHVEVVDGYAYQFQYDYTTALANAPSAAKYCSTKITYYDSNKKFLSCSSAIIDTPVSSDISVTVPIISGAKYFKIRLYVSSVYFKADYFTLTATKE